MQKKYKSILCLAAVVLFSLVAVVFADDSEFRLVVSRNSGAVGARFHVDLEMKTTTTRTLNSLTIDVAYGPELTPFATNPDSNWFAATTGYDLSVSKLGAPNNYYRVLVTGNGIGKSGAGVPAGFNVTTSWQRVVTLRWTIATLSPSYNMAMLNTTDAAAYFDNLANNPEGDLTEWATAPIAPATVKLSVKAFLQGPYDVANHNMLTGLLDLGVIPTTSPYAYDPGTVSSIPANSVDWVMLQLRSTIGGPTIYAKSLFLNKNGNIVGTDGSTATFDILTLEGLKNYYVVVRHRNHLAIMSNAGLALNETSTTLHDFTTAQTKAYGITPMKAMSDGAFALKTGDANADGGVDAIDKNSYWRPNNGTPWAYEKYSDFNLDGGIDAIDANTYWRPNNGSGTQVP